MEQKVKNIVFDTNYTTQLKNGGKPIFENKKKEEQTKTTNTKKGFLDKLIESIIPQKKSKNNTKKTKGKNEETGENPILKNKELKDQIKAIIEMPDNEYSDKKLTSKLRQYISEVEKHYSTTISDYKSHISPSFWEFKSNKFNISGLFGKSYYVQSYPSYIDALRTRDLFSFNSKWDMSFFLYPEDDSAIQGMLKQKATQLKAEINESVSKGITLDTEVEQQYKDVEMIRQKLTTREERYFELGYYINIYDEKEEKLKETGRKFEQKISGYGIKIKNSIQRMDEGFNSILPVCTDDLGITRSSVTSSLAGSFPFMSNDLLNDTGILYGVNSYTGGLVIFDRFNNKLPNMNSCILATSGAGKSFTVKLEILRYLINGIDAIIIDPENEYKDLCEKVGGTYINIATSSQQHLNPFDIPPKIEDVEYGKGDLLRGQIMNLIGLIELLIGDLNTEEEALLDKAIQSTYSLKGFSLDDEDYEGKQPPIMEDLMNTLDGMDGGEKMALKLSKYVTGTFGKIFNNYTNVDINNKMTVFSIRDLEEVLKTPAMFNVLNFIRTKVRSHKKKRMLVCDEAWIMLKHKTSAEFLFGLIKRARKYGVGITTISQDIEDFVKSEYGKPIISNSALQILLKQSTTSIKSLNDLLGLSEAEQRRLVSCGIGEGLMFAGPQHVGVKILASPKEKAFISTNIS
ncbi:MAG TPA: ATP-binding protein [Candidatus Absconditabacterales bacterium]|nr:ATP-binding protein [Candidatus Absconditabacterales bacterium]